MAIAKIQASDGRIITVQVPDGATEQQIMEFVNGIKELRSKPAAKETEQPQPDSLLPSSLNVAGLDTGIPLSPAISSGLVSAGRGLATVARSLGLADMEDPSVTENFKRLQEDRPISTTVGEVAGEAAPFLLPGLFAARAATIPGKIAASGLLGAAEGGLITKGKGGSVEEITKNASVGGSIAGAIELALPVVGRFGSKIYRRLTGTTPTSPILDSSGQPSSEFLEALDTAGITLDDIGNQSDELMNTLNIDDAVSVSRRTFLEGQGIIPTRAQITGDPDLFQAQSELVGQSNMVSNALKTQERALAGRFDNAVTATGGSANPSSSPAVDFIADRAIDLDAQISQAYSAAREAAQTEKIIKPKKLVEAIKAIAGSNTLTGGLASGSRDILKEKGLVGKSGLKLKGRIDAQTAEEVRIGLNGMYDSLTPFGKSKLANLKDALDNDVAEAVGEDVFSGARSAKAKFEKDLRRAKVNKFDKRKKNLVKDVLENKISPDRFLEEAVLSKSVRGADLEQLRDYLLIDQTDDGVAAWNQLRADAMSRIKKIAIKEVAGEPALSRAGLESAMEKIGAQKLKVLFKEDELKFLMDMKKVSKLREPVRGTQASPSGAAIRNLTSAVNKSSLLQGVFSGALETVGRDMSGRAALRNPSLQKLSPNPNIISQSTPALIPLTSREEEQQ
jgi:hypothetical protein